MSKLYKKVTLKYIKYCLEHCVDKTVCNCTFCRRHYPELVQYNYCFTGIANAV